MLDYYGDLLVLGNHGLPRVADLAERVGDVVRLMLNDEALVLCGIVLVVVDKVGLDLEQNLVFTALGAGLDSFFVWLIAHHHL